VVPNLKAEFKKLKVENKRESTNRSSRKNENTEEKDTNVHYTEWERRSR
jgi:hypothetical protein